MNRKPFLDSLGILKPSRNRWIRRDKQLERDTNKKSKISFINTNKLRTKWEPSTKMKSRTLKTNSKMKSIKLDRNVSKINTSWQTPLNNTKQLWLTPTRNNCLNCALYWIRLEMLMEIFLVKYNKRRIKCRENTKINLKLWMQESPNWNKNTTTWNSK